MDKKYSVLDLFCGCGGLSLGFEDAGYNIILGIDNWSDALKTFSFNHQASKTLCQDLSQIDIKEFIRLKGIKDIDVIIGGPPCQGFSIAGKRVLDDERNLLYKSFLKFVELLKPKAFLMENVPNILSMGKGIVKANIINDFSNIGYTLSINKLTASDFGVPQNRKRAFFVGLRKGQIFEFPKPTAIDKINTQDAISDLPDVDLTDKANYTIVAQSSYQIKMRSGSQFVYNHQLTSHKPKTVEIIALVPDGGNYKNLPEKLKDTRKVNIAWTRLNSQKPSFTIDTGHRHHFHYKFNRVPTVRESARIQSFPDKFVFLGSKTSQYKQVGNAVPPLLAKALALTLKKYLDV